MHILFIGYSNLLKKRIIPILNQLPFSKISIAKHESQEWDFDTTFFNLYNDYQEAFDNCSADIIYISTVNSSHYALALKALILRKHVIVDKPATLSSAETSILLREAKNNNLLICESTVYLYHPQFQDIDKFILNSDETIKHITIHFSFPPLNQSNFRYDKNLGGGAIFDTAPYIASIGRHFFKEVPEEVYYKTHESLGELEISYSVILNYTKSRSIYAYCGFNTEYINRLVLLGERLLVDINKVFTIPDNVENVLRFKSHDKETEIIAQKGNSFVNFFNAVIQSIDKRDFQKYYNDMSIDSEIIQKIINKKK